MAAPANKTAKDLNGKWTMNKTLSDSPDPVFTLQGISYLLRKTIGLATIHLDIKQYEGPAKPPNTAAGTFTHVDITQSASGLSSTQEDRCFDDFGREHTDWLFGTIIGKSKWVSLDELEEEHLKKGWLIEGEGESFIYNQAENKEKGWTAYQVWGFQTVNGERRYSRNVLVINGDKRAEVRFVYDFDGERS